MHSFVIKDVNISFNNISKIINENLNLSIDTSTIEKINNSRNYLEKKIKDSDTCYYGINTGFGDLQNVKIDEDDLAQLQANLLKSHACGVGDKVDSEIVRTMILLKIISLSKGFSGIKLATIERLIFFFNNNINPVVYKYGSLGASGDLSPLSHLSLPLIGLGEVEHNGKLYKSKELLNKFNLKPLNLGSKEGLALINGTQYMLASLINSAMHSVNLCEYANLISSISIDAFKCDLSPFDFLISDIRPYKGQINVSRSIIENLKGSELENIKKDDIQDPYSFRCIPQVHGATKETLNYVLEIINIEINSVTDNPLIFVKDDKIISGGNFHGQPLAYAIDFLKISMSELGNISERRVFNLLSGKRGLPPFLINDPGLNSGLMILQYTSASLVSANKQLANPSSIDSITSSNGQEDHVSMGANGANQLRDIIKNLYDIFAIEIITAIQAKEFNKHVSSEIITNFISLIRQIHPIILSDRVFHHDIANISNLLKKNRRIG